MQELAVNSKGIDWLLLEVGWSKEGIKLVIKIDPRVEEYFKTISNGNTSLISAYGGKDWSPVSGGAQLESYGISEEMFHHTRFFCMGYPGYPMFLDAFPNKVNLSFLHLVGASEGKEFIVRTPVSKSGKKDLKMVIEYGMQEFVKEYMMYGKMVIKVSSSEI